MRPVIALTGATGFIGGVIAARLHAGGVPVRALVRHPERAKHLSASVEIIQGSLEQPDALASLVDGAGVVVHCAGAVRGAAEAHFQRVNVQGVEHLLRACLKIERPPRFLHLSSLAAREPGLSFYAASKRGGEEVLLRGGDRLNWIALRPPAVYGPGDKELLPLFKLMGTGIAPVLGNADSRFSMLFIEDLADAVIHWINGGEVASGVHELHDGRIGGYTWDDVIETVERLRGRRVFRFSVPSLVLRIPAALNQVLAQVIRYDPMLTPGKVRELRHHDWVSDNAAFTELTGWTPQVDLEEGLRRTPGWR